MVPTRKRLEETEREEEEAAVEEEEEEVEEGERRGEAVAGLLLILSTVGSCACWLAILLS